MTDVPAELPDQALDIDPGDTPTEPDSFRLHSPAKIPAALTKSRTAEPQQAETPASKRR